MKIVKLKTNGGSEIFINLEHIDYINPDYNSVNFPNRYIELDDESMKKVVELLSEEVSE